MGLLDTIEEINRLTDKEVKQRISPVKVKKVKSGRGKRKIPRSYRQYIVSKYWYKRRNQYFRKFGKVCMRCGSDKSIELHHIKYENYGSEADNDMAALCHNCHDAFHSKYRVKHDMTKDFTEWFVESKVLL